MLCVRLNIGDEDEVTSIKGYTFTSDEFPMPAIIVAPVASTEDMSYLAFGVWLTETEVEAMGTNTITYSFGAFADGGAPVGARPYCSHG